MPSVEVLLVAASCGVGCIAAVVGVIRPELNKIREEVQRVHLRLNGMSRSEPNVVRHVRSVR